MATSARIGIDGFNLAMSRGTGIATYGRVLSHCLTELGHPVDVIYGMTIAAKAPPLLREIAFFNALAEEKSANRPTLLSLDWWYPPRSLPVSDIPITGKVEARGFRSRLPAFDRILNAPDLFAAAARTFRRTGQFLKITVPGTPAIMHWTYPLPIRVVGAHNVYTIHDLVPLRLPYTTTGGVGYHFNLIRACVRFAARICTVSQASLRDIETLFPEAAGRVVNTYQSIMPAPPAPDGDGLRRLLSGVFGLAPRGYFLFFGALEPKKNIARLLEAYLASDSSVPLVLAGGRSWKTEREAKIIASHDTIRQLDYVSADQLKHLIRGARAVLFPSLSEGFGLPVLESMALGTPVLTSREGALPEIAGDAALLVDAYDSEDIASGLRRLDADAALRDRLSASGLEQAKHFDMQNYKQRLTGFYAEMLSCPA